MKEKIFKNLKWCILGALGVLFIILTYMILKDKLVSIDRSIYDFISTVDIKQTCLYITELGDVWGIVIIAALLCAVLRKRKYVVYFAANLSIIAIIGQILKRIVARQRPEGIALIAETGFSFPSGHSITSIAFYGYLIYLLINSNCKKWIKIVLSSLTGLLVLSIGISRIYLGVHYPSDVIGGFLLGSCYLIVFIHFANIISCKIESRKREKAKKLVIKI